MSERNKIIQEVCTGLIGTCSMQDIEAHLEEAGVTNLSDADFTEVDSIVFNCATCGWFCSSDEINDYDDEWHCDQCAENGEDDS